MPTPRPPYPSSSRYHLLSFRRNHSAPGIKKALPQPKKLNIILSLDGVFFAHPFHEEKDDNSKTLLYFLRKSSLFFTKSPRPVPRCVLPGAIELLQLLYSPEIAPSINLSVFNHSSREDARALFAEILTMAIGKDRCEQVIYDTPIYGYNDCEQVPKEHLLLIQTLYGIETPPTYYQKNIYKIVSKKDANSTLLLDANPESICYHQAKNYCAAPFVELQSFDPFIQIPEEENNDATSLMFQQLNSVYYIASQLIKFIMLFRRQQEQVPQVKVTTVTEELFQFHFESIPPSQFSLLKRSQPRFQQRFAEQHHYTTGLNLLKRFNPELTFVDHSQIKATIEKPITTSEQTILEKKHPIELPEVVVPYYPGATSKLYFTSCS